MANKRKNWFWIIGIEVIIVAGILAFSAKFFGSEITLREVPPTPAVEWETVENEDFPLLVTFTPLPEAMNEVVETQAASPVWGTCGPPDGWMAYTVKEGETLAEIALKHDTLAEDIQWANCLGDSQALTEHMVLYVPEVVPQMAVAAEESLSEELANFPRNEIVPTAVVENQLAGVSVDGESKNSTQAEDVGWVELHPAQSEAFIGNPGIGWQYNWGDLNKSPLPETVAYGDRFQLSWQFLNPRDGVYDWSKLDAALAVAVSEGKQFSFRVYTMSGDKHTMPAWVVSKGAKILSSGEPDYSNCVYQQEWGRFVSAMAARYDGNPNIAFIDISGYGYYNEWSWEDQTAFDYLWAQRYAAGTANTSTMEEIDSFARRRLADMFIGGSYNGHTCRNANGTTQKINYSYPGFSSTQLVMPYAGIAQSTEYVFLRRKDVGFRFDCLGADTSLGMLIRLDEELHEIWKNAPVVMETCGAAGYEKNNALVLFSGTHSSVLHNQNINFSDADMIQLAKLAGYRYALKYVGYTASVARGGTLSLEMLWRNVGSAPSYPKMGQQFEVHFYLVNSANVVVQDYVLPSDVANWMPGISGKSEAKGNSIITNLTVPTSLSAGTYKTMVAIIDTRTGKAINLAVNLTSTNGRYLVGEIQITNP